MICQARGLEPSDLMYFKLLQNIDNKDADDPKKRR